MLVEFTQSVPYQVKNTHIPSQPIQECVALWFKDESGRYLVTFTKYGTTFAYASRHEFKIGDTLDIEFKIKEECRPADEHSEVDRTVITHCKLMGIVTERM